MKKILVPVDFSDYSKNAIEVASYIAKVKEMTIVLLHVVEDSYTPYYDMVGMGLAETGALFSYRKELQENLKNELKEIAENVRKKDIQVEYDVIIDSPKTAIVKYAEEHDADLLVLGSHGHSEVEEVFIGGTSEKVIRTSSIPVLTVQKPIENYKINRIVFASDFEEPEIEPVLKKVLDFAEIFMAELFLVRVSTSRDPSLHSRERADELAKKFNLSAGAITTYSDRSEEDGIVNYAKETQSDLIALCTHGRTGLSRFFKRSIAEDVAGSSNVPVLTFNISKLKGIKSFQAIPGERKLKIDHQKREKDV